MKTDIEIIKIAASKPIPPKRNIIQENVNLKKKFFLYNMFEKKDDSKKNLSIENIGSITAGTKKDPITKLGKRISKKKKLSSDISSYNSSDWFEYLKITLKEFGVMIESTIPTVIHREIAEIYDNLVEHQTDRIGNDLLKDYLDWWISTNAHKYATRSITLRYFNNLDKIKTFINGLNHGKELIIAKPEKSVINLTQIEKLGATALLINYGIVTTYYSLIKKINPKEAENEIKKTLEGFSKNMIIKVLTKTKENSPYSQKAINFFHLIEPMLVKLKIKINEEDLLNYFIKE